MVGPSRRRVASGMLKEEDCLTHVAPDRGPVEEWFHKSLSSLDTMKSQTGTILGRGARFRINSRPVASTSTTVASTVTPHLSHGIQRGSTPS